MGVSGTVCLFLHICIRITVILQGTKHELRYSSFDDDKSSELYCHCLLGYGLRQFVIDTSNWTTRENCTINYVNKQCFIVLLLSSVSHLDLSKPSFSFDIFRRRYLRKQ